MAKISLVEKDKKRAYLISRYAKKRSELKKQIKDKKISVEERFDLQLKLNDLPRNSSKCRYRNRCSITGRPRGFYRKFKMSRIALRDLAALGQIPGLTKSSW
jgi:small subunit ribosomal protein S14